MSGPLVVHIPVRIERRLLAVEPDVQKAIRARLKSLAKAAAAALPLRRTIGPKLRFYEGGFRVLYELQVKPRRLAVLELKAAFSLRPVTSKKTPDEDETS